MKIFKLTLALLAGIVTGCTTVPSAPQVSMSDLPNCFDANYDAERRLFTIKSNVANPVNQQCLLTVGPSGNVAPASRLTAGSYTVYLANGGGGGAGGTFQNVGRDSSGGGGGGGGGGGAGAKETQATLYLTEGVYKLTIGAGGPGGSACVFSSGSGGGPGWLGSPSNIVRVATGEVVVGTPGADTYARPTRYQHEREAQKSDLMTGALPGHGGSGPGQASGGAGGETKTAGTAKVEAGAGESKSGSGGSEGGGRPGFMPGNVTDAGGGGGGGGGATSLASGGGGGGETQSYKDLPPVRGSLGSGGGGGAGDLSECDPGAQGGHGYIALRRN